MGRRVVHARHAAKGAGRAQPIDRTAVERKPVAQRSLRIGADAGDAPAQLGARSRHAPRRVDAGEGAGRIVDASEEAAFDEVRVGERIGRLAVDGARHAGGFERGDAVGHAALTRPALGHVHHRGPVRAARRQGREARIGLQLGSPVTSHSAAKLRAVIGTISTSPSAAATGP